MRTVGILLAAGASRRFGEADKLLADLRGRPLVAHAAAAMAAVLPARVAVVSSDAVAAALPGFAHVRISAGSPQSRALHAGLAAARGLRAERVVVALGDMPNIAPEHYRALLARADAKGRAAMTDGQRITPPVVFTRAHFASLATLQGDRGAGALISRWPREVLVEVSPRVLADVDRPADLAALAEGGGPSGQDGQP